MTAGGAERRLARGLAPTSVLWRAREPQINFTPGFPLTLE